MYLSLFDNVNEKFFLFIIQLVLTMLLQKFVNKNKIKLFSVKKSFSNNKKTINIRFNMKTLCSVFYCMHLLSWFYQGHIVEHFLSDLSLVICR